MFMIMKKSRSNIALVFHYVRIKKNISQRTMARLLQIHQSSVSRIEQSRIRPTQFTIDKFLHLAGKPLDELIDDALAARELLERMEAKKTSASKPPKAIDHKDLSSAEKEYLKAKWTVMVHEMDRQMRRKVYRHGKTVQQLHADRQRKTRFEQESQKETQLLNHLKSSQATGQMIGKQENRLAVWADLSSRLGLNRLRKTPAELLLDRCQLEEMQLIRDYRAGMLAKLSSPSR